MHSSFLIKPKISIYLFLFFCVVYVFSFTFFILVHIPLWLHFFACLFLLFHFVYVMRRHVLYRHPLSVTRLWCDDNMGWNIQCRDAHVRSVKLFQSIVVSRYYIFLAFRVPGRWLPLPVTLALDSDNPENMRSLRRLLQTNESMEK